MTCENLVGVKNILVTFFDCDNDVKIGPIAHKLSSEELPTWKNCPWNNERLPQGYTKRQASDAKVQLKVIRDLRVPLALYQGCAAIDLQVEYDNGLVYTGTGGGVIGDTMSDTHEVEMDMSFRIIDELLPAGVSLG
jgi:uncharacterized protein (DUF3820 family)